MSRPKKPRFVDFNPEVIYFKPRGIPLSILEEEILAMDEIEALRLRYDQNLDQTQAAEKMKVSQSTFQRILTSAFQKITRALIKGKALRIEGGDYQMVQTRNRKFKCEDCKYTWEIPFGTGRRGVEMACPKCKSGNVHRIDYEGHGFGRQPWGYKKK